MNSSNKLALVLCTVPNRATGIDLARALVAAKLAACVNVIEGVTSVYQWQADVVEEQEYQLLIKTLPDQIEAAFKLVLSMHPYDLPEWVVLDAHASKDYLNWMKQALS